MKGKGKGKEKVEVWVEVVLSIPVRAVHPRSPTPARPARAHRASSAGGSHSHSRADLAGFVSCERASERSE